MFDKINLTCSLSASVIDKRVPYTFYAKHPWAIFFLVDRDLIFSFIYLLRSTLGERFVIFGDPVVDGIPVHARREDSRFLVTWTGDVQNLRHFE